MARKDKSSDSTRPGRAHLLVPRVNARRTLLDRVERGKQLLSPGLHASLDERKAEYRKWNDYNSELLHRIFSNDQFREEYDGAGYVPIMVLGGMTNEAAEFQTDVNAKLGCLESIIERLDLIDEPPGLSASPPPPPFPPGKEPTGPRSGSDTRAGKPVNNRQVFVVHGRDEEAKAVVARFLEKLDLKPIILHEQPNKGRTVIEKFEANADVAFAVVLVTPDDVGALKPEPDQEPVLKPRARQNVILELGYFIGRLERANVMALTKGEIELPSDYVGVVFTPMDPPELGR